MLDSRRKFISALIALAGPIYLNPFGRFRPSTSKRFVVVDVVSPDFQDCLYQSFENVMAADDLKEYYSKSVALERRGLIFYRGARKTAEGWQVVAEVEASAAREVLNSVSPLISKLQHHGMTVKVSTEDNVDKKLYRERKAVAGVNYFVLA